jgi:hypothetical protein
MSFGLVSYREDGQLELLSNTCVVDPAEIPLSAAIVVDPAAGDLIPSEHGGCQDRGVYTYDGAGVLLTRCLSDEGSTCTSYDEIGRPIEILDSDLGDETVTTLIYGGPQISPSHAALLSKAITTDYLGTRSVDYTYTFAQPGSSGVIRRNGTDGSVAYLDQQGRLILDNVLWERGQIALHNFGNVFFNRPWDRPFYHPDEVMNWSIASGDGAPTHRASYDFEAVDGGTSRLTHVTYQEEDASAQMTFQYEDRRLVRELGVYQGVEGYPSNTATAYHYGCPDSVELYQQ